MTAAEVREAAKAVAAMAEVKAAEEMAAATVAAARAEAMAGEAMAGAERVVEVRVAVATVSKRARRSGSRSGAEFAVDLEALLSRSHPEVVPTCSRRRSIGSQTARWW